MRAPVFHTSMGPVKRPGLRPVELTEREMTKLLQAFVQDKDEVLEADCLLLVKWAQTQRLGALCVEMIIEGKLVPSIHAGEVFVGLPGGPHEEAPGISEFSE